MRTTQLDFKQARDLLVSVVRQPYAWPGGYERLIATEDGGLLCSECCRKEARRIMSDIRDGYDTGWYPAGSTYEAVSAKHCRKFPDGDDLISSCSHCYREFGEFGC